MIANETNTVARKVANVIINFPYSILKSLHLALSITIDNESIVARVVTHALIVFEAIVGSNNDLILKPQTLDNTP